VSKEYIPPFRGSRETAKQTDELALWACSLAENKSRACEQPLAGEAYYHSKGQIIIAGGIS